MDARSLWERYQRGLYTHEATGITLDLSRMDIDAAWWSSMTGAMARAFSAMKSLEEGALANPDEGRMVGHYWLRDPALAPTADMRQAIETARADITRFAREVHAAGRFRNVLVVGIGGSALGPQFVSNALTKVNDACRVFFIDNTDPDGIDRTLATIARDGGLSATLTVVISKSGGTKETRNGMLEVKRAYELTGLAFAAHAVAVTGEGSELDRTAKTEGWIKTFPMWDWVGGRTSELSAVGLLPAALQGFDIDAMLDGARAMDAATRLADVSANPAAQMALAWHFAGGGRGQKDMVVLPYKDRLELFSRYLQQLVMESLGKERDLDGRVVHQGITVYGNKGSTDQHAYVQQLRDGVANFFVTFIEVLRDRDGASMEVEPDVTAGDYLAGFLEGTRRALYESGRRSITLTVPTVDARTVGALIALYERTVGLYATLVNINAYHQPGVEAGKKAAGAVIDAQRKVLAALRASGGETLTVEEVASRANVADAEAVFKVLRHLAANGRGVERVRDDGVFGGRFRLTSR